MKAAARPGTNGLASQGQDSLTAWWRAAATAAPASTHAAVVRPWPFNGYHARETARLLSQLLGSDPVARLGGAWDVGRVFLLSLPVLGVEMSWQ